MVFYVFIFLFGLIAGSFLNSVIYRLALPNFSWKNLGGLRDRSYCPNCKHVLGASDLIPLFSFFILKGKCRYCRQKISWQYPLVELATGIVFLLISLTAPHTNISSGVYLLVHLPYLLVISSFLLVIFVYDLKHYIIPDRIVYPAVGVAFLYRLFEVFEFRILNLFRISNFEFRIFDPLVNPLASAVIASSFFLTIVLISRGKWMGIGDIKLAFLMGLFLGFPNILVALFSAFAGGAIIGIGLIALGVKTLKSEVPFGPFLVAGTFVALFWGERIVNWYFNLLL